MIINNVGYKFAHNKNFRINRPNGSGDYAILFLRTGAIFTLGGIEVESEPDSFILYRKGTPQFFRANGESFVNDWLHFDLSIEEEKEIEKMGISFDLPIKLGDIVFFSKTIKNMYQEKYSTNPHKEKTLKLYFELIMLKLSEALDSQSGQVNSVYRDNFSKLRARIYNEPDFDWQIELMARETSLSVSYFQHLYKNIFGVSVWDDVISSRIERAQFLLVSTDHGVSRIADECGYKNDVHFMRQFKKEVGITPSSYRKEMRISSFEKEKMYQKAPYNISHKP